MSTNSIRLSVTTEVEDVMSKLKTRYSPMTESEILKLGLAELYSKQEPVDKLQNVAKKGRERFARWLKENKGVDINSLTEEQVYEIIENA